MVDVGGYTAPTARFSSLTCEANDLAAARNMASVTDDAPEASEPRATPGKMNALLAKPGANVAPLYFTGAKSVPLANTALPLDHSYACVAVHSAFDVGLDSAKITGRGLNAHIDSITPLVKTCGCAAAPTSAVGLTDLTASSRLDVNDVPGLDANGALSSDISYSAGRPSTTKPLLSKRNTLDRATASSTPSSTRARTSSSAAPMLA
mmetsp:Transcript_8695/g.35210  ORF Transcript_8695/g.35210 Transcript_8695/m.35210 type:complete len:207 (-) Transcript_8695:1351-1971(-)